MGFKKSNVENTKFKIRRGVDLIHQYEQMPEPRVLWNGIIEGASGLITGVAKTGKTTFAENLALSLAVGKSDFFGKTIYGKPRKVLFINLEEKLWRIGRRNKRQISNFTKEELNLFSKNYFTGPKGFPEFLNTEKDWRKLNQYIYEVNPDVIFLDSLTHMCIGEIERSAIAQDFIQNYKRFVLSLNKTVFVIHHNTKGNNKPMTQDNIAGSRVITQEFDFAIGFGNVPTSQGGNYSCIVYNKDAEKTSSFGGLYAFDKNMWINKLKDVNIYDLYNDKKSKPKDGRIDTTMQELLYDFINSKYSQGSQVTSTKDLKEKFVWTQTISKQGMYDNINKLLNDEKIIRKEGSKGEYLPKLDELSDNLNEKEDERR